MVSSLPIIIGGSLLLVIILIVGVVLAFSISRSTNSSSSSSSSTGTSSGSSSAGTSGATGARGTTTNTNATGTCNPVDISDPRFTSCYLLNTNIQDNSRFYDTITDMTIATINPQTVPSATELCIQFCNNTVLPLNCSDPNFQSCVNNLLPNCPIGKSNLINYYPVGRGFISCYPPKA